LNLTQGKKDIDDKAERVIQHQKRIRIARRDRNMARKASIALPDDAGARRKGTKK